MADGKKSRVQILRELVAAAEKSKNRATFDVPFRGQSVPLVKVRVGVDFPLYRIQSGRTHRAQTLHLEQHPDLPKDFFADPEDPRVQAAQRQILLQMIKEKGLDEDLEQRHQQSPIVLTYDGFIVDGNRRVTALREQKEEYAVAVVLAENATSAEVYETELELQMAKDTKSEYNWLDELIHLHYGAHKLKESLDKIAKRMRKSKDLLKEDLDCLMCVDQYLAWLGAPGQYHKVPSASGGSMRQAFIDLNLGLKSAAVRKLSGTAKDALRSTCFAAIQNGSGYEVIRAIIRQVSKQPEVVVERLQEDTAVMKSLPAARPAAQQKKKKDDGPTDPLAELAAADVASTSEAFVVLGNVFENPAASKAAAPALVRIAEELGEEERESKKQTTVVQTLERVEGTLEKLQIDGQTGSLDRVAKVLGNIDGHVSRLAKVVSGLRKDR